MKWMKKAISATLAALLLAQTVAVAAATQVHYFPDVTADMANASFWSQSTELLMTAEEIAKSNEGNVIASGTNVFDLRDNAPTVDGIALNEALKKSAQADAAYYLGWTYLGTQKLATQADYNVLIANTRNPKTTRTQNICYGIAVKRSALRAFPSYVPIWDDLNDTDFDYQYLVGIRVNEPLVITSISRDRKFYLAKSNCCSGWIPVEDVAICKDKAQWLEAWDFAPEKALVVYGDRVYTEQSVVGAQTSELMLTMGTVLELAENVNPNQLIDNRAAYNNYVVWMPIRKTDGSYDRKLTLISQHNDVREGYFPLTEENIAKIALNALGNTYGWGGSLHAEDCSNYVRNIYKCFGLELARNTTWQTAMPMAKVDFRNMCREERIAALDALPLGTILFFSGHEMLYLGKRDGNYYVISAVGSILQPGSDTVKQRIRGVILNTLEIKRANGKMWIDELTDAIVPYWEQNAPQLPQKAWYHDGVAYCLKNGLMQPDENKLFRPMDAITYGELLRIFYGMEQAPEIADAVEWAKTNEICPKEQDLAASVNRQQMASLLFAYAKYRQMDVTVGESTNLLSYDDVGDIAENAMAAMQYAAGAGLIKGKTERTLNPLTAVTRAEAAVILQRFLQNTKA